MKERRVNMEVEIVLGNPKIDCNGIGICKFITKRSEFSHTKNRLDNTIRVTISAIDEKLEFEIYKNNINSDILEKHFLKNGFTICSEIKLPLTIVEALKIGPSVLIKGNYKVEELDCFLRLKLNLKPIGKNYVLPEVCCP